MELASRCVPGGGPFERLTIGTPERNAGVQPLLARFDGGATTAAGLTSPSVNPQIFVVVGASCGSPQPRVGHDFIAGSIRNIGEHKFARSGDEAGELRNAQRSDETEGMYSACKTNLGFKNIADAGQERLRKQRCADTELRLGAKTPRDFGRIIFCGQHRWTKLIENAATPQRIRG